MSTLDLNADLGEAFGAWRMGDDEAMLGLVTSANIACGFHAGDPSVMRRTAQAAVAAGVVIGAHVSYPDLRGFGRRDVELPPAQVSDDVLYQIGALDAFARAAGSRVRYVKAHGALYNRSARDPALAAALVGAVADYDHPLAVLALPGSAVSEAAGRAGIPFVPEGFADRAYTAAGSLVPRDQPGAVLAEVAAVARRSVAMARGEAIATGEGTTTCLAVRSLCVHGDTPGAVAMATAIRRSLSEAGVRVAPFCV